VERSIFVPVPVISGRVSACARARVDVDETPIAVDRIERLIHAFEDFDGGGERYVVRVQSRFRRQQAFVGFI